MAETFDWEKETKEFKIHTKRVWKKSDEIADVLARYKELYELLQKEKETEKRFLSALRSMSKDMRTEFAQIQRIITGNANSVTKKRKKRSKNKNTGNKAEN